MLVWSWYSISASARAVFSTVDHMTGLTPLYKPPFNKNLPNSDIIVDSDAHNTLETAVLAAELDGALSAPNASLTVFAPTDDAFAAIPAEVLEGLLADPTALSQILLYHVVGSSALSSDLSNGMMIETLQGGEVMVTITNGIVKINEATVTVSNILTYNGVVHVLDAVIQELPENVLDVVVDEDDK